MSEYKMFTSKEGIDIFDALLKAQYQPSEENTKRLKFLQDEVTKSLARSQSQKEKEFIKKWGSELFDFVAKISKPNFLVGKTDPFSLTWDAKQDTVNERDEDDYWTVTFYKGVFTYKMGICGGYGGYKILEENISQERVLELINPQ